MRSAMQDVCRKRGSGHQQALQRLHGLGQQVPRRERDGSGAGPHPTGTESRAEALPPPPPVARSGADQHRRRLREGAKGLRSSPCTARMSAMRGPASARSERTAVRLAGWPWVKTSR
jgi:hypothetical protein